MSTDSRHLIIAFASNLSEAGSAALQSLQLPHLEKLLRRLSPLPLQVGDEFSLSPPHERALAQALGLPVNDGLIPWAALQASQRAELAPMGGAWAFITLCHWQVNIHHVAMSHLPLPDLGAPESDALLAAMQPYFEEDGIRLHPDQPGRWLAQGEVFADIASASTDRVVGRNLEAWMPRSKQAAPLRRLQNEMQMLLYTHAVNDARSARGVVPVNSFWLSGTGALPPRQAMPSASQHPTVIDTLRDAAVTDNWPAWTQAWQELDAHQIKSMLLAEARGESVQLTLCSERSSQSWQTRPLPIWHKFRRVFGTQRLSDVLGKL